MDKNDVVGQTFLYGGSLTACSAAPAAHFDSSMLLLAFSALGAFSAIAGLAYTVWNGNRNFKLAQQQLLLKQQELFDDGQ
jgi:ABC-type transport system involved in cytochrome c biogenesis permease subunit